MNHIAASLEKALNKILDGDTNPHFICPSYQQKQAWNVLVEEPGLVEIKGKVKAKHPGVFFELTVVQEKGGVFLVLNSQLFRKKATLN